MTGRSVVVCLMGPTASGKSAVALELATRLDAEIVSVDSAMVYRGMDVGTAKPIARDRESIVHHLIDIREPHEVYSAAAFLDDADVAIRAILARGRLPLLVGGTMLYFRAFKQGLAELPRGSPAVRAELKARLDSDGGAALHRELTAVDAEAAMRIHSNDPQRLVRALEVFRLSGVPMTTWWKRAQATPLGRQYRTFEFALVPERPEIHAAIERRFDAMLASGLLDEVRALLARGLSGELPALRAVGYRQAVEYLQGRHTYGEMRTRAIAATRQLAKRQLTWLARWRDVELLDPLRADAPAAILNSLEAARIVGRS